MTLIVAGPVRMWLYHTSLIIALCDATMFMYSLMVDVVFSLSSQCNITSHLLGIYSYIYGEHLLLAC